MKKRWLVMAALAGLLTLTAACQKEDAVSENTASEDAGIASQFPDSSVTKLGNYKGIQVAKTDTTVTDEEVQEQIDGLLASYPESRPVEGKTTVEDGDTVNIDFVGKRDGEAFDGGSSDEGGYDLTIGSGSFIPGFEEGLIGAAVGSSLELPLTFPEDYSLNPDMAGVDVVFEVTVNAIVEKVDAEWTDEFVKEHTEYSTIEEFDAGVRESLQQQKEEQAASDKEYNVMQAIVDGSEFELGEADLQPLIDSNTQQYETYASYYGVELEEFVTGYMGTTIEEFDAQIKDAAEFQVQCTLAVDAIAKAENITLTDEEYQTGLEGLASDYGAESAEAFEEQYGKSMIENSLIYDKTIDYVTEQAVEN